MSTNVSTERTASEKRFPKMKRGLAGMIYLSYICTRNSAKGDLEGLVKLGYVDIIPVNKVKSIYARSMKFKELVD